MNLKINAAFNRVQTQQPISILSVILAPNDKQPFSRLVIAKESIFTLEKANNTALIVDNPLQENYDMLFNDGDFMHSVQAWKNLQASQRLVINHELSKHNPHNVLESIGRKDNGVEALNIDTLSNGNLAILATCLFFYKQIQQEKANDMLEQLQTMQETNTDNTQNFYQNFFISI